MWEYNLQSAAKKDHEGLTHVPMSWVGSDHVPYGTHAFEATVAITAINF